MTFSPDNRVLAVQGDGPDFLLSTWLWEKGVCFGSMKLSSCVPPTPLAFLHSPRAEGEKSMSVYQISFNPHVPAALGASESATLGCISHHLCVTGPNMFKLLRIALDISGNTMKLVPSYAKVDLGTFAAHAWLGSDRLIVGTKDRLLVFNGMDLVWESNILDVAPTGDSLSNRENVESKMSTAYGHASSATSRRLSRTTSFVNESESRCYGVRRILPWSMNGMIVATASGHILFYQKSIESDKFRLIRFVSVLLPSFSKPLMQSDLLLQKLVQKNEAVHWMALSPNEDSLMVSTASHQLLSLTVPSDALSTISLLTSAFDQTSSSANIEASNLPFERLLPPFHSVPISSVDVCARRPLVASCSEDDHSLRLFNFQDSSCEVMHRFSEDTQRPLSVSLHPSSLYCAVAFSKYACLLNIYENEVRINWTIKDSRFSSIHQVKISPGGQFVGIASDTGVWIYNIWSRALIAWCGDAMVEEGDAEEDGDEEPGVVVAGAENGCSQIVWKADDSAFLALSSDARTLSLWEFHVQSNEPSLIPCGKKTLSRQTNRENIDLNSFEFFYTTNKIMSWTAPTTTDAFATNNPQTVNAISTFAFFPHKTHSSTVLTTALASTTTTTSSNESAPMRISTAIPPKLEHRVSSSVGINLCVSLTDGRWMELCVVMMDGSSSCSVVNEIQLHHTFTSIALHSTADVLFGTTEHGTVQTFSLPLTTAIPTHELLSVHQGRIQTCAISHDGSTLITAGTDASVSLLKVRQSPTTAHRKRASHSLPMANADTHQIRVASIPVCDDFASEREAFKDVVYSDDVLISMEEVQQRSDVMENYQRQVEELRSDNELQVKIKSSLNDEKSRDVTMKFGTEIDVLRNQCDKVRMEMSVFAENGATELNAMKDAHQAVIEQMNANFESKMLAESMCIVQCTDIRRAHELSYETQKESIQLRLATAKEKLKVDFDGSLEASNHQLSTHQLSIREKNHDFQMAQQCLDSVVEEESLFLTLKYEQLLKHEQANTHGIQNDRDMVSRRCNQLKRSVDELKTELSKKVEDVKKLQVMVKSYERDAVSLHKEIVERKETIIDKDKRISGLKKKNQELEKFKFVLDYKIQEFLNQLEPKRLELIHLQQTMSNMTAEEGVYRDKQDELRREHQTIHFKLHSKLLDLNRERNRAGLVKNTMKSVHKDVYNLLSIAMVDLRKETVKEATDVIAEESTSERWLDQWTSGATWNQFKARLCVLHRKYCAATTDDEYDTASSSSSTKKANLLPHVEPKNFTSISKQLNHEFNRSKIHLRSLITSMETQNAHGWATLRRNNTRLITEQVFLIAQTNQLKRL